MQADVLEVVAEARFHAAARGAIERNAAGVQRCVNHGGRGANPGLGGRPVRRCASEDGIGFLRTAPRAIAAAGARGLALQTRRSTGVRSARLGPGARSACPRRNGHRTTQQPRGHLERGL
jgi:hypothetical protein